MPPDPHVRRKLCGVTECRTRREKTREGVKSGIAHEQRVSVGNRVERKAKKGDYQMQSSRGG